MPRLALGLEYDGTAFCGWQRQPGARTVQGALERALNRVAAAPVATVCAGRTDAGVHARGQVVHFDTGATRSERSWVLGGNANLPDDVSIRWARVVGEDFSARFSARARHYRYTILNRFTRPALARHRACWIHRDLDLDAMRAAAVSLTGEHDFSAYRAVECQAKSPVRTVYRLDISRESECIWIDVVANAFLHHMVRNISGVLIQIGEGRKPVHWAIEVLDSRDRRQGGITAPAAGLSLESVIYPPDFGLPCPAPDAVSKKSPFLVT